jgi:hypothetical protein
MIDAMDSKYYHFLFPVLVAGFELLILELWVKCFITAQQECNQMFIFDAE